MANKTKYYIKSGLFDSVCFATSPKHAAIEACQFVHSGTILEEFMFVTEIEKAKQSYMYNTVNVLNEAGISGLGRITGI